MSMYVYMVKYADMRKDADVQTLCVEIFEY